MLTEFSGAQILLTGDNFSCLKQKIRTVARHSFFSHTPLILLILPCLQKRRNWLSLVWLCSFSFQSLNLQLFSSHTLRLSKMSVLLSYPHCSHDNIPLPSACRVAVSFKLLTLPLASHSVEWFYSILHSATRVICTEHIGNRVIFPRFRWPLNAYKVKPESCQNLRPSKI